MKGYDELNYDQISTVVSRFLNSCARLKRSGDYPEKESDEKILNILITMKFRIGKDEGRI